MKKVAITIVGVVLSGSAVFTMAGTKASEQLALCKSEIQAVYGAEVNTRLKSVKQRRSGTQMSIYTIPPEGESVMLTCVVDREGELNLTDRDGVAVAVPTYDTADKVSLSD